MDHINAPLLWDQRTAARFKWLYFDVTTYAPYHAEAQEMPSLLIGRRCLSCMPGSRPPVACLQSGLPCLRGGARVPPAVAKDAGEDAVWMF